MDLDRESRLKALEVDDQMRGVLRECKAAVAAIIDDAIAESYRKILAYPEVQKVYAGTKIEEARRAQRTHWLDDVFSATFTEEQLRSGINIFTERARQGLPLRSFFIFYTNILRRMVGAVTSIYRRKPEKLLQAIDVLTRVVMFELELAAACYMNEGQEQLSRVVHQTADGFEREVSGVVGKVTSSVTQLKAAAQTMETVAKDTAGQSQTASSAAQQTSSNIATVAAATEELNASIQEISRQVGKSAQIAEAAVTKASETNQLVQGLADAVGKIGDIVKLINDIASQTNLLALNATIEAARAGDAGKGFAVVAGEVKNLANQTARATGDISAQIGAVQAATRNAVAAIGEIGAVIVSINEISTSVASAVEEQGAATQEIARSVQSAAEGGRQVSDTIASVSALAGKAEGTAHGLSKAVDGLSSQADLLSSQVTNFLAKIRGG